MMNLKGQAHASLFGSVLGTGIALPSLPMTSVLSVPLIVVLQGIFPVSVSHTMRLLANKCFTVKER